MGSSKQKINKTHMNLLVGPFGGCSGAIGQYTYRPTAWIVSCYAHLAQPLQLAALYFYHEIHLALYLSRILILPK